MGGESVQGLLNLGPKSREWLEAIGVRTLADLRRVGAVPAYVALKRIRGRVSLNMLYALAGAVDGVHWLDVKRERRLELLLQVEDCERLEGSPDRSDAPPSAPPR